MKNSIKLIAMIFALFIASCTDLQEQILDESLSGGGLESDLVKGVIVPAYGMLPEFYRHTRYFAVQEISSDEAILPYRGGRDWGDNGIYIELHQHTWGPIHSNIQQCWDFLTVMISRTVTAINVLSPLADTDAEAKLFLAEARGLRAFYNMIVLDLWGITFKKDDQGELSEILRGNDAVEYIKSEFEAVINDLRTDVGPGRLTRSGAYALLARLHLNAAVWREPYASSFNFTDDDMTKVIQYSDLIINSGQYALSPEYFAIFDNDNHDNPELIFAIDQRPELNGHNRLSYFSMSDNFYANPAYPRGNGTDGPAITSDFYESWETAYGDTDPAESDARFWWERMVIPADSAIAEENFEVNRGVYRGLQYGLQNTGRRLPFIQTEDGRFKIGKLRDWRRAEENAYVDFEKEINFTAEGSDYNTGYRVLKYQWSKSSDDGRNKGEADLVIVRLADMFMMRAEAKLRMGDASALADVNLVRASRTARPEVTPPPLASLDLDILFRERGFEFYWEHQRRTDMIRFGKYEGTWTEKTDSNVQRRVFPIPQSAIDGASSVDGYLNQNPGY